MVERWCLGVDPGCGSMYEHPTGDWVRHDDYKALLDKLEKIRLKCEHEISLDNRTPPFAEGRMDFADVIWRMIVQEQPK